MAYCDRCGAYVPDGWTSCPACGYDKEKEEKMRAAAQAQAAREESARSELEEAERRRAERRENDRIWAERERQRREREQEELHRRQQEQEERSRQEKEKLGGEKTEFSFDKAGEKVREFVNSDAVNRLEKELGTGGRVLPILSYLGPLFLLPLLLGEDEFTKFHARQGMRLFIWSAILTGVGSIFHIGWAVSVFSLFLSIIGIKNVINNKTEPLPYIGK